MRNDIITQAQAVRASMDTAAAVLTDEQAAEAVYLYLPWQTNTTYAEGDMRHDFDKLYRCIQPHTSQDDWRPAATPALWQLISTEEWPEWVQPAGAHDAYAQGAKVTHNEKRWTSDVDGNVWEPGVYGWTEYVEEV